MGDMNHFMGHGYQAEIAMRYLAYRPDDNLQFGNRGESGHTSSNLVARWHRDAFPYEAREAGYRGVFDATETKLAKHGVDWRGNGMHFNGSIGVATLRRDGFAGLVADGRGEVVTKPLAFSGGHLFVNAECRFGALSAEVLEADGAVVPGFSAADCRTFARKDAVKAELRWKNADLSALAGRPVRLRFKLHCGTLYSFWVARDASGKSGGYVAAGGPAYPGLRDL